MIKMTKSQLRNMINEAVDIKLNQYLNEGNWFEDRINRTRYRWGNDDALKNQELSDYHLDSVRNFIKNRFSGTKFDIFNFKLSSPYFMYEDGRKLLRNITLNVSFKPVRGVNLRTNDIIFTRPVDTRITYDDNEAIMSSEYKGYHDKYEIDKQRLEFININNGDIIDIKEFSKQFGSELLQELLEYINGIRKMVYGLDMTRLKAY